MNIAYSDNYQRDLILHFMNDNFMIYQFKYNAVGGVMMVFRDVSTDIYFELHTIDGCDNSHYIKLSVVDDFDDGGITDVLYNDYTYNKPLVDYTDLQYIINAYIKNESE